MATTLAVAAASLVLLLAAAPGCSFDVDKYLVDGGGAQTGGAAGVAGGQPGPGGLGGGAPASIDGSPGSPGIDAGSAGSGGGGDTCSHDFDNGSFMCSGSAGSWECLCMFGTRINNCHSYAPFCSEALNCCTF